MICREGTILLGFFFTLLVVVVLCFNFWYVIFLVDVHSLAVSLSLSLSHGQKIWETVCLSLQKFKYWILLFCCFCLLGLSCFVLGHCSWLTIPIQNRKIGSFQIEWKENCSSERAVINALEFVFEFPISLV